MQWDIHFGPNYRVCIESDPHIESLSGLFFELPFVRIPFLLDAIVHRRDFHTETCGVHFPENQDEEDDELDLIEEGCIKLSGHYTRSGFMEAAVFERLLIEFANMVFSKYQDDDRIQEKWEYNRRKEWFKNDEYYNYVISFPERWEVAMEEGIRRLQITRAR